MPSFVLGLVAASFAFAVASETTELLQAQAEEHTSFGAVRSALFKAASYVSSSTTDKAKKRTVSHVVSEDESLCLDGAPDDLEGALATLKAGPVGKAFRNSWSKNGTCAEHGFPVESKENPCYPASHVHLSATTPAFLFKDFLDDFQSEYDLEEEIASDAFFCSCHPGGKLRRDDPDRSAECAELPLTGSWIHRNADDSVEFMCLEGPWEHMIRVLSIMKTSKQLPMHLHDQLAPKSCKELGFVVGPMEMSPGDFHCHCFPPAAGYYKSMDVLSQCAPYEGSLFAGGYDEYVQANDLDAITLGTDSGCNCLRGSDVGEHTDQDWCDSTPNKRSPIRKFWDPYWD